MEDNYMSKRTQGYFRKQRIRHINRKKGIIKRVSGYSEYKIWYYKHEGMLNKGKIHCSCPLCRFNHPSHSDLKKMDKMNYSEMEYKKSA